MALTDAEYEVLKTSGLNPAGIKAFATALADSGGVITDYGTFSTAIAYPPAAVVTYNGGRYITPLGTPAEAFFADRWVQLGGVLFLVLPFADPVPPGTLPGTIIFRR